MRLYVVKNLTTSGGRWLEVAPGRFPGWIDSFALRHSGPAPDSSLATAVTSENIMFTAPDGAIAKCYPPFWESQTELRKYGDMPASEVARAAAAHALADRAVGVLLVRLGGYAAGVFTGSPPRLAGSQAGSRLVHGRSAAGGWSQQRFARRREKQVSEALQAASDAAAGVWRRWADGEGRSAHDKDAAGREAGGGGTTATSGTRGTGLDVVVLGGDKRAIAVVSEDQRLAPYLALATDRFLTVPDPRLAVLRDTPRLFLAVRIFLTEPPA